MENMKERHFRINRCLGALATVGLVGTLAACAGSAAPGASSPAAAKGASRGAASTSSPAIRAVDDIALAQQLADLGQRTNSPLALAAAAQIVLNTPTRPFEGQSEGGTQPATTDRTGKGAPPRLQLDANQLLTQARNMPGANQNITGIIQQLQSRAGATARGALGGPQGPHYDRVLAGATDTYRITFRGGEPAAIRVRGDGDTDLDCYVYDQNGRLVAVDDDTTDYCVLNWYPGSTGTHRLEIRNLRDVYNAYVLTTN
jgi:hypothetical protein